MQIVVNKLLTHYELLGKGDLVLLLHGWGDNLSTYRSLQDTLSDTYSVVAVDLPGFGTTEPPTQPWDLDDYSDFTRALVDKLGFKSVYAVVGHSNGGALAIRAVSLGMLKPQKLVLLSSAGIRTTNRTRKLLIKSMAKIGKIITVGLPRKYKNRLQRLFYGVIGSDLLVTPALQETFKRTVKQDIQPDAAKLTVPSLIIYGKSDKATPVSDGKLFNKIISNSKLHILDGGHFIHHDQKSKVNSIIKDFLK